MPVTGAPGPTSSLVIQAPPATPTDGPCAISLTGRRGDIGRSLTPNLTSTLKWIDVYVKAGDSQVAGARDSMTDLPTSSPYSSPTFVPNPNAWIWNGQAQRIDAFVPGPQEQQPGGAAYVDPFYTNTIGGGGPFVREWGRDRPGVPILLFNHHRGGGRFTDANTTFGRAANYKETFSDGAAAEMISNWTALKAALAALGYRPRIVAAFWTMGGNPVGDATETSTFLADNTSFIAWWRGNMIGNAKLLVARMSIQQNTGGMDPARFASIVADQQTIVQNEVAAGRKAELINCDDIPVIGASIPDYIHWATGGHLALGEREYYHVADFWYPNKEWAYLGGNPVVHGFIPGDYRNGQVNSGAQVQTLWNIGGSASRPTNGNTTNDPAITATVLPDGSKAFFGSGDGNDDILKVGANLLPSPMALFAAVKGPATGNKVVLGFGGELTNPFVIPIKSHSNGGGNLTYWHRADDGSIIEADFGLIAFDNTVKFVQVTKTGTTLTGRVNATTSANITDTTTGGTALTRTAVHGLNYSGGTDALWSAAGVGAIWFATSLPDATYSNNAQAFVTRNWIGEVKAQSETSFGAMAGTADATVGAATINATSTTAFGAMAGNASSTVDVFALTNGAFGALGGTATAVESAPAATSSTAFGAIAGTATAVGYVAATSTTAFGAMLGTASAAAPISAITNGAFGPLGGTATAQEGSLVASSATAFGAMSGTASAVVLGQAQATTAFGPVLGNASAAVASVAAGAGAFGALGGTASAAVAGVATSSTAFGALGGTSTAVAPAAAQSSTAFGPILGSASANAPVSALSSGQFGPLAGVSSAKVDGFATSNTAFGPLGGSAQVAGSGVFVDSATAFGPMLGNASGQVAVSSLSNGQFGAISGTAGAIVTVQATSATAFGPMEGTETAANDNPVQDLWMRVVS